MAVLDHEGTYSIMYGRHAVPVGAGYRPGYLSRPDNAGRFPVVVVVPDIDGLSSHEKDLARRFARNGIATLTLDLYRDHSGDSIVDYQRLSDRQAATDLDEVHEFLLSDDVDWAHADAIGMLGLDVGGRFALAAAANRPWVRSVAVCYTPLTGDEDREKPVGDILDHLSVPVLGLYGADDELIDTATVDEAQQRNDSGKWLLYDNAGHGFLNINAEGYDAAAAADAEHRLIEFFLQTLPAAEPRDLG